MPSLLARIARRASLGHIRHLPAIPPAGATGLVAAVYRQMENEFGMLAPPVALHAADPEVLAAVWMILRETLLAGDPADRAAKEAIAAGVSLGNSCQYCVEVHGAALFGLRTDDDARRIAGGQIDDVRDPRLRALADWARRSGERTGASLTPPPFTAAHTADFVGVAVTFHYINRMVTIFLSESPLEPIPSRGHGLARQGAARLLGHFARVGLSAGSSRTLLPDAALPGDVRWATGAPAIAGAMARGCAAIDRAGSAVVAPAIRDLVLRGLADRAETGPGISAGPWLATQLNDLEPGDRPIARLALLTAWSPHRVTESELDALRAAGYGAAALVAITAWAALAAARQIGQDLYRAHSLSTLADEPAPEPS